MRDRPLALLLFRTHAILVCVAAAALLVPMAGLLYTRALLSSLIDDELANLDAEEAIYRAAWKVEVVARHASRACLANPQLDESTIVPEIHAADRELVDVLAVDAAQANARLVRSARAYHELVADVAPDTCDKLGRIAGQRLALDEALTDAWIEQLRSLHVSMQTGERRVRNTSAITAGVAMGLGLLGVLAAALIARRSARRIRGPIGEASALATRLGRGDFSPIEVSSGDITELRALTDALGRMRHDLAALDRMKQQLLASVSHELHTPLGKMREALALLGDGTAGPLTPRQARVVALAREACEREVRTVSALLDASRLRSGQPLRIKTGCSIDDVIRAALDDERPEAEARGVSLVFDDAGTLPSLSIDFELVAHALANLVRNAISVSPSGAAIEVSRTVADRAALIHVLDHGPGLPPALRGDPFAAFESAAVGERPAGLGLGLGLAREVARAHGGDLVVEHTGSQGTCFALHLPMVEGQDGAS